MMWKENQMSKEIMRVLTKILFTNAIDETEKRRKGILSNFLFKLNHCFDSHIFPRLIMAFNFVRYAKQMTFTYNISIDISQLFSQITIIAIVILCLLFPFIWPKQHKSLWIELSRKTRRYKVRINLCGKAKREERNHIKCLCQTFLSVLYFKQSRQGMELSNFCNTI